jgi:hypothetical protein
MFDDGHQTAPEPLDLAAIMRHHESHADLAGICWPRESLREEARHTRCPTYRLAQLADDRWHYMRSAEDERDEARSALAAEKQARIAADASRDEWRTRAQSAEALREPQSRVEPCGCPSELVRMVSHQRGCSEAEEDW